MKRAAPHRAARRESIGALGSDLADVGSGRSLLSLLDLELHRITLGERPEALRLDRRVMDEHVFAPVVRCDETIPLAVVEPLHLTLGHLTQPPDSGSVRSPLPPTRSSPCCTAHRMSHECEHSPQMALRCLDPRAKNVLTVYLPRAGAIKAPRRARPRRPVGRRD